MQPNLVGVVTVSTDQTINEESILTSREGLEPSTFHFWNGDVYEGGFIRKKEKQKILMQGTGAYKTADGHTYEGFWDSDTLRSGTVTFPDKSVFTGHLREMKREGFGSYFFKENVEIKGEFEDDGFRGKLILVDPHDHLWKAEVKKEDSEGIFVPLHCFWQTVLTLTSKEQEFYGEEEESWFGEY